MYHCFLRVLTKVVKFCTNLEDSKTGSGVDALGRCVQMGLEQYMPSMYQQCTKTKGHVADAKEIMSALTH